MPSIEHAALLRVIESRDQIHQRAFARAGRPDDGDDAAAGHVETDVVQHRLGRVVAEGDMLEIAPRPGPAGNGLASGFSGTRRPGRQHFVQPPA